MNVSQNYLALPKLVTGRAQANPDRIAIKTHSETLTYSQMEMQANQLAHYLLALGAGREVLVGVCIERSPRFVIAALAIMKSGAAYLPIDPNDPDDRLRFIAKDAGIGLIVTDERRRPTFADSNTRAIALDVEQKTIGRLPSDTPNIGIAPDDLAYIIYTSGSTGKPKGVEIVHRNLSNLITWHVRAFSVDTETRATFQAGVGFDAGVWEIWPHLSAGATLCLPDQSTRMNPEQLRNWLVANQITISFAPTAIAEQLLALPWPKTTALRFLLTGADVLHRFPPAGLPFAFVNNYGPTECAVVTTSGIIAPRESGDGLPSIGLPIDNVQVQVVNEQLQGVPDGTSGEICIAGAGIGRGYRNRAELTAQKFIAIEGIRSYRTGDLGRRLPSGEIAFLGRIDDQVKIRGYRIELGEINAVLNEWPSIQASVVIARDDAPGDKRLVAYVVPAANAKRDEQALREWIRQRLPDYMEPSAFVWIDALSVTANGKIDRAALPPPNLETDSRAAEFVAPRNPIEEALAEIIAEVLKIRHVSVHDDFFLLGAHSLLGAQIVAHVRATFGAELKLLDVFDAPTVAQLSLRIEQALAKQASDMSETEIGAAMIAVNETAGSS